jgi:hypothetical protein
LQHTLTFSFFAIFINFGPSFGYKNSLYVMTITQYCKTLFEMMKYSQGNLKKVFNKDHKSSDVGGVKKVIFLNLANLEPIGGILFGFLRF